MEGHSPRAGRDYDVLWAWVIAFAGAWLVFATGIGEGVERQARNLQSSVLEKRATGDLAIVEIDSASLQALEAWPWQREIYARLVTRLSQAGVELIAFDVDFSSPSTPGQDHLFARALAEASATVVLPTFKQRATWADGGYAESLPLEMFSRSAFLGSVNVHPDSQGRLDSYSYGTVTGGLPRPSLASLIAGASGEVDTQFAIDQSINPATIPAYSFSSVLEAPDDFLAQLRGKKVIVGATAIELGDRYTTSRHSVVPGVVIQALAAETLMHGTDFNNFGYIPSFVLTALLMLFVGLRMKGRSNGLALATIAMVMGLVGLRMLVQSLKLGTFSNLAAFVFLGLFLLAGRALRTQNALRTTKFIDPASGLPNEAAFEAFVAGRSGSQFIIGKVHDFGDLLEIVPYKGRRDMFENIARRLALVAQDERVYHLGGGYFAWSMDDGYRDGLDDYFQSILALFRSPVLVGSQRMTVEFGFSIGRESIEGAKNVALRVARDGRQWSWHDGEMLSETEQKVELLADLETALECGDVWLAYQPKWDLARDRLDGVEALARWTHSERGDISAATFVPILEASGKIGTFTLHIIKSALIDLAEWHASDPDLHCSVNISAKLLTDARFVEKAILAVDEAPIENSCVVFEITESAALAEIEQSIEALERIKAAGIAISIDDYGTGQSTMSYLQRLPAAEIKIDQSFVRTIEHDSANRIMVGSTIQMAQALGLRVVGEGIEDQRCLDILKEFGCDVGQGWHISKPLTAADFVANWLRPNGQLSA
jgi:EAL domain-containing protein (putative c-di-GMP-specific phosphodiesterase class I)/CHASE2 domain-containing sensor protein